MTRKNTRWKRLYTYIYYLFYFTYHTCKYAYTYTYSPLSSSSWLRARRIKWCERPCVCIELHRVSPRVQSDIISLYDYVISISFSPALDFRPIITFINCLFHCEQRFSISKDRRRRKFFLRLAWTAWFPDFVLTRILEPFWWCTCLLSRVVHFFASRFRLCT